MKRSLAFGRRACGTPAPSSFASTVSALLLALLALSGCKRKVSQQQCDELIDRFAELVVKEHFPDAGPDVVAAEKIRERAEAKGDELRNCTSEVQANEHACAMKAKSSEALIKCLE
jgi:hypothetical protein